MAFHDISVIVPRYTEIYPVISEDRAGGAAFGHGANLSMWCYSASANTTITTTATNSNQLTQVPSHALLADATNSRFPNQTMLESRLSSPSIQKEKRVETSRASITTGPFHWHDVLQRSSGCVLLSLTLKTQAKQDLLHLERYVEGCQVCWHAWC